jgi:hypothetical protein
MIRRRLLLCWVGAVLVLLPACSGPRDPGAAGSPPPGATGPPETAVPEVLDFSAPKLGGGTVNGAVYAKADVAIWFWAPW